MLESEELNISEISRRTGLSHSSTANHLQFLVKAGLLTEKKFNRIRIFRLERTSPFVELLNRFFSEWGRLQVAPLEQPFN
jgi:predicted transcriptional regulator